MPRYKVIVNPTAGKGSAGRSIAQIENQLQSHGLDYQLFVSEYPGHATELAAKAVVEGFDVVVAAGGDGTAQQVLNGILKSSAGVNGTIAMGVLPIGSGNDFAFSMGIPASLEESCRLLAEGRVHWIDIGQVEGNGDIEGRYFGNGIGIGFDTVVGLEAAKLPLTGFLAYLVAALKTVFLYFKPPLLEIELDGETISQYCLMVSVMNGRRLGGGFWVAPESQRDDGVFDLVIAERAGKLRIFVLLSMVMKGKHTREPEFKLRRSRRVVIRAKQGVLPVHADGETICTDGVELTMEILPRKLALICNPRQPAP